MRTSLHPKMLAARVMTAGGLSGLYRVTGPNGAKMTIVASDMNAPDAAIAEGWEHVSVSLPNRCPNWPEMCWVKDMFWEEEETVIQLHPPKSTWISNHPYCLHLWRNTRADQALPPAIMVGIKELGDLSR